MDHGDSKTTAREYQRSVFVNSLYKELEAMSSSENKGAQCLKTAAMEYIDTGLTLDECVDLLILSGFPADLSREYLESSFPKTEPKELSASSPGSLWDFTYEDNYGRLFTGRETGELLEASSEEEANEKAREIVTEAGNGNRLIEVRPLNDGS